MSWMPTQEPILGDKRSCDALDLIIVPRVRDLGGGFSVRRALPHAKRQMVGPFIFFDQMGPVQLIAGRGMDVRPHPHIGLATDGRVVHRNSQGNALEITPGAMNLMTAGRGIAHSERSPLTCARAARDYSGFKAGSRFHRHKRKLTVFSAFRCRKPPDHRGRRCTGPGDCWFHFRHKVASGSALGMALRGSVACCGRERAA